MHGTDRHPCARWHKNVHRNVLVHVGPGRSASATSMLVVLSQTAFLLDCFIIKYFMNKSNWLL